MKKLTIIALLLGSQIALPALAGDRERRGPPQRAFDACAELNVEDACQVETRRGDTITGQCRVPHRKRQTASVDGDAALLCVPEHRRGRHPDRGERTDRGERPEPTDNELI